MRWSGRFALLCLACPPVPLEVCWIRCELLLHRYGTMAAIDFRINVDGEELLNCVVALWTLELIYRHR